MAEKPFCFQAKVEKDRTVLLKFSMRYSNWDVVEIIVLASNGNYWVLSDLCVKGTVFLQAAEDSQILLFSLFLVWLECITFPVE